MHNDIGSTRTEDRGKSAGPSRASSSGSRTLLTPNDGNGEDHHSESQPPSRMYTTRSCVGNVGILWRYSPTAGTARSWWSRGQPGPFGLAHFGTNQVSSVAISIIECQLIACSTTSARSIDPSSQQFSHCYGCRIGIRRALPAASQEPSRSGKVNQLPSQPLIGICLASNTVGLTPSSPKFNRMQVSPTKSSDPTLVSSQLARLKG